MPKIIIGFTGSFGSGCSHIAISHVQTKGYNFISLSDILRNSFREKYHKDAINRKELQDYGDELRNTNGSGYLACLAIDIIEKNKEHDYWVIDSIRNPFEIKSFREYCSQFFLIGVFAKSETRWARIKGAYTGNEKDFTIDDERDSNEDFQHGQRVRDCFAISDLVIINNKNYNPGSRDFDVMESKINDFINLINDPSSRPPSEEESLMAIAYASSLRSSCLKRRVGAVIVDNRGVIVSSGFNEVPLGEDPCKPAHGNCYRDIKKNELKQKLDKILPDPEMNSEIKQLVFKEQKMLERCRALHAEENAILNIARFGSQVNLKEATLYTTTYPCNLCANKITQVGIGTIVYLEPYPQEEAKILLDARNIKQKPFEGVSYKGYFRLFGSQNL